MKSLIKTHLKIHLKTSHPQFLPANLAIILSIFTFVTSAISTPAFAAQQQKWYQVELILFAINNTEEAYTENWPELPNISNVENKIELITPTSVSRLDSQNNNTNAKQTQVQATQPMQTSESFSTIKKSEYRLTVTANKLKNSPKYDLLLHIGWRQPAFRSKEKSAVYLHDGPDQPISESVSVSSTHQESVDTSTQITEFGDRGISELVAEEFENTMETRKNLGPEPDLRRYFGTFKLTLSRFLHIDIDMIYRGLKDSSFLTPIDIQTNVQSDIQENVAENINNELQTSFNNFGASDFGNTRLPTPQNYRLLTSRRVKPDEIHFFDHPKFGLITMVTRYARPKPEDEEPTMQPFIP